MKNRIIGPFFFIEKSITGLVYQDMLEEFLYPQVADLQPQVIFQQDGAPPHWSLDVQNFPQRILPRSLDWMQQTNLLATTFARHHSTGLLPLAVCKSVCVCDSSTRSSWFTNPYPSHNCKSINGQVGQNMAWNRIHTWYWSCFQWCTYRGVLVCSWQWKFFEFVFHLIPTSFHNSAYLVSSD